MRLEFDRANRASLAVLAGHHERASWTLRGVLFPGQVRELELTLEEPPLAGRLTARASVRTRAQVVSRETHVLMVPWRQADALAPVALAAQAVVGGRRRRRPLATNAAR